jgi:hypothetical protein
VLGLGALLALIGGGAFAQQIGVVSGVPDVPAAPRKAPTPLPAQAVGVVSGLPDLPDEPPKAPAPAPSQTVGIASGVPDVPAAAPKAPAPAGSQTVGIVSGVPDVPAAKRLAPVPAGSSTVGIVCDSDCGPTCGPACGSVCGSVCGPVCGSVGWSVYSPLFGPVSHQVCEPVCAPICGPCCAPVGAKKVPCPPCDSTLGVVCGMDSMLECTPACPPTCAPKAPTLPSCETIGIVSGLPCLPDAPRKSATMGIVCGLDSALAPRPKSSTVGVVSGLPDLPDAPSALSEAASALAEWMCHASPGCEAVERMPYLMGSFFARAGAGTLQTGSRPVTGTVPLPLMFTATAPSNFVANNPTTMQAAFTSVPYAGPNGFSFTPPAFLPDPNRTVLSVQANTVANPIIITGIGQGVPLAENAAFTSAVQAAFPGAVFTNGGATVASTPVAGPHVLLTTDVFSNAFVYSVPGTGIVGTAPVLTAFLLANPAGGGLAGRNLYFENGSAVMRDRLYLTYAGVSDFQGPGGRSISINRWTLGGEATFLHDLFSVEVRLPMASTAGSTQTTTDAVSSLDQFEPGNVGLLGKVALYSDERVRATAGLGLSLPTARDSRLNTNSATLLEIDNTTVLIQPIVGVAWAPSDRLFVQGGMQFDIDPAGNPVRAAVPTGGLAKVGTLHDQAYLYLHAGGGCWVYLDNAHDAWLSGVALLGELSYAKSMAARDEISTGTFLVAPLDDRVNGLNLTLGTNVLLSKQASLSTGFAFPIGGPRQYDWVAQVQLNWIFGAPR